MPRLISAWALIGVVPYLADALLILYGTLGLSSTPHTILILPLRLNEMVLALWLITRGSRQA